MAIIFDIGFKVTDNKDIVKAIGPQLKTISQEIDAAFKLPAGGGLSKELVAATHQANILQNALKKATTDKGISFVSLNSELRKAGTSAEHLLSTLARGGPQFANTFNTAAVSIATANRNLIGFSSKLAEMKRVMTQSIKFTAAQTIQREFAKAISSSIGWVEDLNKAVTDISVVTGKTGAELDKVYERAVEGSKQLRIAADEYAKGALIFYQQGLNDDEVTRRTDVTVKAAKAAGASIEEMSSQLTSIWNNYRMVGEEQERAASVGAALAANTAVDFADIAEAMQSAAAPAAQMGVEYNQLAAIIATVGDVSQQSASTIGNAYKTIFSRFQQLKAEGTDGEVTLSSVSSQLESMGIKVLDAAGNLRDLGVVIDEVGHNWDNWTQTQQTAIAQIVGGTRQYGQFLTLMQNFDKYEKNLGIANAEDGSELEAQYGRALDSIESKAENAAEAWKRAFAGVFDEDLIKGFYEGIEKLGNAVDGIFSAFGDWKGILVIVGSLLAKQIVPTLVNAGRSVKDTFSNITPRQRENNRLKENNQTRSSDIQQVLEKQGNGLSEEAKKNFQKELESANNEKSQKDRSQRLKALAQEIASNEKLVVAEKQSLQVLMQKSNIQQKLGEMAGEIEKLEKLGTAEAASKAEMLRKQMELYGQGLMTLIDQTNEVERQNLLIQTHLKSEKQQNNNRAEERRQQIQEEIDELTRQLEEKSQEAEKKANMADAESNKNKPKKQSQKSWDKHLKELQSAAEAASAEVAELNDKLTELEVAQKAVTDASNDANQVILEQQDILKISSVVNEALAEALSDPNSSDAAQAVEEKLRAAFENSNLYRALDEALNNHSGDLEEIGLAISEFIGAGFSKEALTDEMRAKLQQVYDILHQGREMEGTSGNIFLSLSEGVGSFSDGLGAAITGLTDVAAAFSIAAVSAKAMFTALEEGDLPGFIAGLAGAASGVVSFAEAIPGAIGGFKALGSGLVDLGQGISKVIPGLSGIASTAVGAGGIAVVAIAAVTAAAYGLYKVFMAWRDTWPEVILQKARQAAEDASKTFDQTRQAAQELFASFDDYKSAVDKLNECTQGTTEWYDALLNVQGIVNDLLDKYPELVQYLTYDENGVPQISEEGMNYAKDRAVQDEVNAYGGKVYSQGKVQKLETEQQKQNIQEDYDELMSLIQQQGDSLDEDTLAKILEGAVGKTGQELQDMIVEALVQKKVDLYGTDEYTTEDTYREQILTGLENSTADKEIEQFAINLNSITTQMEATEAAQKAMEEGILTQVANLEGIELSEKNKSFLSQAFGAKVSNRADELEGKGFEELVKMFTGQSMEAGGYTEKDGKVTIAGIEYTEATLAAAIAMQEVRTNLDDLSRAANDATQGLDETAQSYLSNGDMSQVGYGKLAGITDEDSVKGMYGDNLNNIVAQMNGVDVATNDMINEFVNGVITAANDAKARIAAAGADLSSKTGAVFNELLDSGKLQDLSAQGAENLSGSLVDIFNNFGQEGLDEYEQILTNMGTDADIFANTLNQIDWKNASIESVREQIKELGGEAIAVSNKDLQKLIDMMRKLGQTSLEAATEMYNNFRGVSQKITDNGSVISQEDIELLQQAGMNTQQYFTRLADGTYALKEDADQVKSIIEGISLGPLMEAQVDLTTKYENIEAAKELYGGTSEESLFNSQKVEILAALGEITEEQGQKMLDLINSGDTGDRNLGESQLNEAFEKANISLEKFDEALSDTALTLQEAQEGLAEQQFRDRVSEEGFDVDATQRYAERLQEESTRTVTGSDGSEKEVKMAEQTAQRMAINNQKLERGIKNLNSNLKDYKKRLSDANKGTMDWSEAMDEAKQDLADIVGFTDKDFLSDTFVKDKIASEDLQKALKGDEEALQSLKKAAYEELGKSVVDRLENTDEDEWESPKDIEGEDIYKNLSEAQEAARTAWGNIQSIMNTAITTDGTIDASAFEENMNELITATGMTHDEITSMLGSMGVDAEVITTSTPQQVQVNPTIRKVKVTSTSWEDMSPPDSDSNSLAAQQGLNSIKIPTYETEETVTQGPPKTVTSWVPSYSVKVNSDGEESGGKSTLLKQRLGNTGGGGSGGGGSSSSSPKHVSTTSRKQPSRYKNRKNAIEDVTNSLSKLNKANDHAWGSQRIRNIDLINKQLKQQAKEYQMLRKEAENYISTDSDELLKGVAELNELVGDELKLPAPQFDPDGLLDNEEDIENAFTNFLNKHYIDPIRAAEKEMNDIIKSGESEENDRYKDLKEQKEALEDQQSEIEEWYEEKIGQPMTNLQDAWRERQEALQNEMDLIYEWLANQIEKYTIKMELHLEISDIDYRLHEALIDNMGEVGKMSHQVSQMISDDLARIGTDVDAVITHYNGMEDLMARWNNGDVTLQSELGISQKAWDEARASGTIPQEIKDAMSGDIDSLFDLRSQVWEKLDDQWQNYIDVISYYIDEYDRITDRLDKQASISDNLLSIIETTGLSYKWGADESAAQYKNMSTQMEILTAKAKNLNGELAIASDRRKEAEEELNKLLAGRNAYQFSQEANEAEMFEYNRIKEHYDEMADLEADLNEQRIGLMAEAYEKAAEYAEQWGEVIRHEFDEALNGLFDSLDEAMDVYNQKRDIDTFFMDDVDRVFELNKLQREVNDVIEDISNPEQLARYNALLEEIEAKKADGVKMTEKDLEILQAQFDLEQARDAYEDAKNAKNSMRLMRDASGNYAYVYSADQDNIDDTEAKVEEAMHNIYKMHREAADEYAETWLQLQVDWRTFISEIDDARYAQDVDYRDMVNQRMEWYAEQSDLLSNEIVKHNDAIDRSFTDMTLSVITKTEDMAATNEMYKQNHADLKDALIDNYQQWIDKADETMHEVGGSMSDLEDVVENETDLMMDEVGNLKQSIEDLNTESQSVLTEFAGFIGNWVTDVNREFDEVIRKIDEVIAKYREMLQAQQDGANNYEQGTSYGYDAERNYSSSIINRAKALMASGVDDINEIMSDYYIDRFIWERYNKMTSNAMQGHEFYKDPKYYTIDMLRDEIEEMIRALDENSKALNEKDASDKSQQVGNQNSQFESGKDYSEVGLPGMATGGLVRSRQTIEIAEEGPELVLNNEDTNKILEAVRLVRSQTQQALAQRTIETALQTLQQEAILSEYQRNYAAGQASALEQSVHIEASFPNVNTAAEVEAALNSLIVQAAHYSVNNK